MPNHDVVEDILEKHFNIIVFRLEVVANNGHDTLVGPLIHVANHGGPFSYALDMLRYDPNMLENPTWLHAPNHVNPIAGANLRHLEDKDFVRLITLA
jgi:hypothetical protein